MKNRTRVLRLAGVTVIGALALTACSGTQPASEQSTLAVSDDPVTLTVSWWGNEKRTELTGQMIDLFEAKYPNITIETTSSDYTSYWDKLGTQVAGGNAPDVIQMADTFINTYVTNETLLDLGTVSSILDTSNYAEAALASGSVDGTLYGLSTGSTAWAVLANKTLFEQAGVELPDDKTWTWDDFAEIAATITDATGGAAFGTSGLPAQDQDLAWWARQNGENIWSEDGGVGISAATIEDYFTFVKRLIDIGASPSAEQLVEDRAAGVSGGYMATNRAAMGMLTHIQLNAVSAASGDDWTILRIPDSTGNGVSFFKPAMFWSISATTEHPAEAALFVDFMLNDLDAAKISLTERGIPANEKVQEAIAPLLDPVNATALEYSRTLASEIGDAELLPPPGGGSVGVILQKYTDQVNFGQATPAQAAEGFLEELNSELENAK